MPRSVLVIGIGNDYRGDDAAGLEIVRRVRDAGLEGVTIQEEGGDVALLIESWVEADMVVLADAVRSGASPGTIFHFDARTEPIPHVFVPHLSSHGIGLAEVIELAQALDQLPPHLVVYGIEGEVFETGAGLSPQVERAAVSAAARILEEAREYLLHQP